MSPILSIFAFSLSECLLEIGHIRDISETYHSPINHLSFSRCYVQDKIDECRLITFSLTNADIAAWIDDEGMVG